MTPYKMARSRSDRTIIEFIIRVDNRRSSLVSRSWIKEKEFQFSDQRNREIKKLTLALDR